MTVIDRTDADLVRQIRWESTPEGRQSLAFKEWLVTNGLGGYATGTVSGAITRRYHSLLVAALPTPFGRTVMLNEIWEQLRFRDGRVVTLAQLIPTSGGTGLDSSSYLVAFRLEAGLPVWEYDVEGVRFEKRVVMPHLQNTTHVSYTLLSSEPVRLELRPMIAFRLHEAPVNHPVTAPYGVHALGDQFEVLPGGDLPPLRLFLHGKEKAFTVIPEFFSSLVYELEQHRGYECCGDLWSPGYFRLMLTPDTPGTLIASTESWETIGALSPSELLHAEHRRRARLVEAARTVPVKGMAAELVLAADQFIITPAGRVEEAARARAMGDEVRTVVAGYHWFTDWGRDTMISLEGLTLCTGRQREAGYILRTFGHYVRDGLIPNMFPEGTKEGLYHTADATLWFFHAIHRYLLATGDRSTLRQLLPKLKSIIQHHVAGTHFGIGVDPADGLLRQGAGGYQLTWMDAKVDDWVVTPRRGKAVEINALWYNALRLVTEWLRDEGDSMALETHEYAERARTSFNQRFWYPEGGYLYDVIDGESGDDSACRPNQILAISLDHPVLNVDQWRPVFGVVRDRLLTPVGLRSLSPGHRDYKAQYYGDLRARDAAYHQGTVWGWLAGPFVDAWLKVFPDDKAGARQCLDGFDAHLNEAGIGTLSEIFDAEQPYTPRGCIAQAWTVAEVLRAWLLTDSSAAAPHPKP
ncbi:MAG TPA: amylo-alpha-1,6-glucosidase [Vicinamibacterales bacterium]|jgi:predicted glycogen debranching enzyme|nr:amylo-alpha-1,6-glucosidase [Vicinamibacterales bacterium]